ncbi:YdbH domain-containing protein [Pseudodesulfovibrio sp.]|uniref:intermembrane phospholipid transport protein YdbH family protein n=1 Tax=Pseudodesulfovibrio sp. TaxID=2035812 RepID=UPI00262FA2E8|nr:YdbH domain-containing protein [Pseudodesulfovibrio sp.]MDD3312545.1 YdbH domain-containing protein [Pseudodesulfovibrio sp.]
MLKWTALIVPWLLAVALGAGWWLTVWTPGYLERLVPKLAGDMGLPLAEFHIRDAGLFSADIGPVRLGDEADGLRLANVHVTYTPASLKLGRVHAVILDGASLSVAYDGKGFACPALDRLPKSDNGGSSGDLPDLPFDTLTLRDATLHCLIDGRALSAPFSADIEPGRTLHFSGRLRPRDQAVEVEGDLGPTWNDLALVVRAKALQLGAFADLLPRPVTGEADLSLRARIDLARPDALRGEFEVSAARCGLDALGLRLADGAVLRARGTVADRTLSFSMDDVSLSAPAPIRVGIRSGGASAESVFVRFALAGAGVELDGRLDAGRRRDGGGLWDVSLSAANPARLNLEAGGRTVRLDGFALTVRGTAGPQSADVLLQCDTRATAIDKTGFGSGPVRLTLPLRWPAAKAGKPGQVRLSGLRLRERKLGDVAARVRQRGAAVAYDGTLSTELLPGLRVPFSGISSLIDNRTDLSFGVGGYALSDGFDPATLAPSLKGVTLTGTLRAEGTLKVDEEGVQSRLGASFSDGVLAMDANGTAIRGINAAFVSPDLIGLRSAPAQQLTFDSLQSGKIALTNGKVTYQLEAGGAVLVERAGFDWCGGHVFSNAFRVVPGSDAYGVTLYCSELRLSALLAQLELANAEGEAALSGELPVTWERGKIAFNGGFLHSTPGEGGVIRVEAMRELVAAIPEGTPQRGQLELAREAVRDYQYKWVRIKADSVGENLLVRLSLDGKPARVLPFVYKKEFGGFIRVIGDVQGSNFQGLRLDVNFSVPLNRILLYKDIVHMIQ